MGGNIELVANLGRAELAPVSKDLHDLAPPWFREGIERVHGSITKAIA